MKLIDTLTDWMGIPVKHGDTVIVFRTQTILGDTNVWIKLGEHKIRKRRGMLVYDLKTNCGTLTLNIRMLELGLPADVICIKGISDDRNKYMEYMKTN